MSADSAVSIVWDVFKIVFVPIKHQFEYVMCSKRYADGLRKEVGKLEYEAARVRNAKEVARNNLQNIHAWVPGFLANAEEALKEAGDLLGKFEEASKSCCHGTLPDPNCRYQFSREAKHKTDDIKNLILENSGKEISLSCPAPGNVAPPTPDRREGEEFYESRETMIRSIMDALADDTKSVVGVHGMGGVGKSTLLGDAEKRLRGKNLFDLVAKADVSENPDIKRIQGEIAHWLGLTDLEKVDNVSLRANLLRERLEEEEQKRKKVLIMLDNLWERLDLDEVGIPCGHDNKARGCKLLLTARDQRVLRREMRCDIAFLLGELEKEEAKRLFEKMVGGKVQVELEPLVEEALRICVGLPFLIVVISKLFIDTSYSDCEYALKQIWSEDTGKVITNTLQLSYGRISKEAKSLLRLCAAYGVSMPSLEYLARYSFGLGIFGGVSSMQEVRDRLSFLIRTLQASSLLLDSEDAHGFKIHDLVGEFVASFASTDHPLLVLKDKDKWETALSEDKLKSCEAICFPYVDLEELPEELVCPELRIFLLFENNKSLEISDSYFNSMTNLMVLHLIGIRLNRLPSPFQLLEKLHSLCLDYCLLEDVAILGELKGLQILSLKNSNIQRLPKEIGQLVELRMLDLSWCSQLEIIEPDVLGRLTKLEELYMEGSFCRWNAVKLTPATKASLIELNNMKKLHTLYVSILNPSELPKDLDVEKLTEYRIRIGTEHRWLGYEGSSTLDLKLDSTSDILQGGCIQSMFGRTDNLFLVGMDGNEQSICALSQKGFPKLKHLQVENSPFVHYILQSPSQIDFKTLESLLLKHLINLEKICCSHISSSKSFSTLKVVQVERCNKMEVLFPRSVARELVQLEEIKVVRCKLLRGIVEADDGSGKFELPKLRVLKLCDLPNIENFITAGSAPLSSTSEDQVGTQIACFNGQQVAFPRLETLEINGLGNFRFMFFSSMVKSLTQLRELSVTDCEKMEAIIMEEEGSRVEISETLIFPMLTDLHLVELESLTCFSRQKCSQEGRNQGHIQLHSSVLFNREVSFPFLESLKIERLPNLKEIWSDESPLELSNLQSLEVVRCDVLSYTFTQSMATNLVGLTKLRIRKCGLLTEVISEEGGREGHVVAFNQLKYIELDGLIGLRCFYSGGYTLMLPLLEEVIVTGCPKMKFFSKRPIEASKLERVQISKEMWFWKDNLNITIQHIFEEMVMATGVKNMLLSEFPELIGKWHSELNPIKSYWELESLIVDKCQSFINAIPSRLMLVLKNMKTLQVRDCESLEEIFDLEGLGTVESTRVLPSFATLDLVNLPKLRRLWNKDLQGSLPYNFLFYITLYKCSNLTHAFVPSMARCLANLGRMEIKECGQMEGVIAEEEGQGSAVEKILFPKLKLLKLECLPNLTSFLLGKNHTLECPELRWLTIAHCPQMRNLAWQSLMEIDNGSPSLFTPQVQFPRLHQMVLSHMDNLSKVWTDDPQETLTFDSLWKVEVKNCGSLENLFPYWVATSLTQLWNLRVESCWIKEIVANGDDTSHSATAQVLFPKLRSLVLHNMPRLKTFCPNLPTLNWPFLKEVRVTHYDKVNISSFVASINKWTQRNDQQDLSDQEAHSSFERDGKFPGDIFGKLEAITLACFHDENPIFPPKFLLDRFHNMKSLEVFCGSFEDIFLDEGIVDEGKHSVLESLRKLKLSKLHKLKRVWREDYLVSKILRSIKTLEVWDCPNLTTLFPAATSFENLTKLVVKNSSGLVHLGTASAVTNLVHLKKITIIGCGRMKEVVADDGNGEGKVISFRNLYHLRLQNLPSLECFSSTITSCILRFPSLMFIEVQECPKMKIFSKGTLSTPILRWVTLFRYKWNDGWEGDLNRAIQELSA